MSEIADHLKERIAKVRLARFFGETVWAIGLCVSVAGLFLKILLLTSAGFSLLFAGLYLSVHYELQRLDYTRALERISHQEK